MSLYPIFEERRKKVSEYVLNIMDLQKWSRVKPNCIYCYLSLPSAYPSFVARIARKQGDRKRQIP